MTPLERYRTEVANGILRPDPAQEAAVVATQSLYEELVAAAPAPTVGLWDRLKRRRAKHVGPSVRGLYMWGGVGRGKTHLVNAFYSALSFEERLRIHFHRFMQGIHDELKGLPETPDPLQIVAERLAEQARVLCLDEFHVSDIADAMLLGRLLGALIERGVTLVTTSNIPPDQLYRDGLQRQRFLPAIDLLKAHTHVIHLDSEEDYRLRALEQAEIYHSPLDADAEASLMRSFRKLGPESEREGEVLDIAGRPIHTVRTADGIAWFEFRALCDGPRGTADYIEIARCYHTVILANVPLLGPEDNERAMRFIHLVDELYDRNVNLIVSAAGQPDDLYYPEGRLVFAFERTRSRLEEMRSHAYLARKHLP